MNAYIQQNQPPGVPPLKLTGERTLPDVPAENYWFRRHLVVYEWIAQRVSGMRVLDLACGEGYGSQALAARAASVIAVDANPEAYEHARLRYRGPSLRFERDLLECHGEPGSYEAVVFLQTIEHVRDPAAVLGHVRELLGPGGTAYVSTPNVLTLAPKGTARSDNPWHLREYRHEEFLALCSGAFDGVTLLGLHHARKLRVHELALRCGWDALHRALGITERFYGRFVPTISTKDFVLRPDRLERALDFLAICS
jgi:2-polyprenyl-3-methyl-5-hydroxy-6-metoxy-1,4-benzoquinol methylase